MDKSSSGALTFLAVEKPSNKDLSIGDWTNAFLVFTDVYCEKFPQALHGLLAYTAQARQLHATAGPRAMNHYDRQFRSIRRTSGWPWGDR
jgi:hypothetical protein